MAKKGDCVKHTAKYFSIIIIAYIIIAFGILFAPVLTGNVSYDYENGQKRIKHHVSEFFDKRIIMFQMPEKGVACAEVAREMLNTIGAYAPNELEIIKTSGEQKIGEFIFSIDDTLGEITAVLGGELAGKNEPNYFKITAMLEKNVFGFNNIQHYTKAKLDLAGISNSKTLNVQKGSFKTNNFECEFG